MSKLREKFIKILLEVDKIDGTECEQITDDFSVRFIEWKDKEYLESRIGLMDRGFSVYMPKNGNPIEVTTQELQQYFKDNIYGKE